MTSSKIILLKIATESPPFPVATKPPSRKIKIGQVQLNTSFSNQYYFPLAAGMLQAYAKKHLAFPDHYEFIEIIYRFPKNLRELYEISEKLSECDIVGYDNLVWNEQHTLALAHECKQRNPNVINVFGFQTIRSAKP